MVEDHCTVLLSRDNHTIVIRNDICSSYPERFLWSGPPLDEVYEADVIDQFNQYASVINENISLAFNVRTRQRYPIPVIRVNGRFICRSGFFVWGFD